MSAFNKKPLSIRHESWEEGEAVLIKCRPNFADLMAFKEAVSVITDEEGNVIGTDANEAEASTLLLSRFIVGWTLFDEDHNEVPYSKEAVEELDGAYAQYVLERIGKIMSDLHSAKEQKDFLPSPSEPTEAS